MCPSFIFYYSIFFGSGPLPPAWKISYPSAPMAKAVHVKSTQDCVRSAGTYPDFFSQIGISRMFRPRRIA